MNVHFGPQVTAFLRALHMNPEYPKQPITNAFAMELLIFAALMVYFVAIRASLSVEKPGAVQHLAEMTNEFVSEQGESVIGHG